MSRLNRPEDKAPNPSKFFLEWKSNDKCFSFYDKTNERNVQVPLPFEFLFLEHYHVVKGWDDKNQCGITSNEVFNIGQEEMTVRSFKGGQIATGFYPKIKDSVKAKGGVYHRSIYAMSAKGEIINIQLKGAATMAYSDFYNENSGKIGKDHWISITETKSGKKGSITFNTPVFTVGKKVTDAEDAKANGVAKILQEYMDAYFKQSNNVEDTPKEEKVVDKSQEEDDLPF